MALTLNIGKCSLLGNYRENNEDSIEVKQFPDLTVTVVADGMGGQAAGEIASRKAIEVIPRELRKSLTSNINAEGVKNAIRRAIVQANEEIMSMGALDKEMRNMGTKCDHKLGCCVVRHAQRHRPDLQRERRNQ